MIHKDFIFLKKVLNILIKQGKKETKYNSIDIIYKSMQNVKPILYLQKLRKSSKVFYLPDVITNEKKLSIGLR